MRELLKATLKTAGGSGGNLLLGVITMKIMAVVLGPSGIGLYSLLRQTTDFSRGLGTLGGEIALVQGLSSRQGKAKDSYLVTTFWVFAVGALSITLALTIFAPWIAPWVFDRGDDQTVSLVRWLALPVVLWVASSYVGGVINSLRAIGLLALMQVLGAAATASIAYPVSRLVDVGYPVAFIVLVSAPPAVGLALGTWFALRAGWLAPLLPGLGMRLHSASLRHFFSLAGAMFIVGLAGAGAGLIIRSLIVRLEGLDAAGVFSVAWTLSMTYIMLVLSSFGTYYLPTLSQMGDPRERIALMQRVIRLATLLVVPLVVSVIVLKPLVIEVLYTEEFLGALEIIRWMLLGDYLKVTAWVVAMPAVAYADMRVYLCTELLWSVGFLAFSVLALFGFDSVQGIGVGFLLMYLVYLAYYLYYVRRRHQFLLTKAMAVPWLLGLVLLVGASWQTWSETHVDWFTAPIWIGVATGFSWLSLSRRERREIFRLALRREKVGP